MTASNITFLLFLALIVVPCLALNSIPIFEERFDDCPCNVTMGGLARRPSRLYAELVKVGEQNQQAPCSTYSLFSPVPVNSTSQLFCQKREIRGEGSYILRWCNRENDINARMELFEIRRRNSPLCEIDPSQDEIQAEQCEPSCSVTCGVRNPTSTRMSPENSLTTAIEHEVPRTPFFNTASRLIRGKLIPEQDKLPYVALVRHLNQRNETLRSICTGSLIGNKWVLTAGHCNNTRGDEVVIGRRWDEATGQLKDFGDSYNVTKVYRPDGYHVFQDPCNSSIIGVHNHDIALLELEKEVRNAASLAIHLNTDCTYPYDCSHLRVSGHGRGCAEEEDANGGLTFTLKTTVVRAIDFPTCNRELQKAGLRLAVHELRNASHLCAFHDECGSGLCNGDSGGPLTMRRLKVDYTGALKVQVGVATWHVSECGRKGRPDVFEPVAEYAEWIHATTRGEAKMYPPYQPNLPKCPFSYDGIKFRDQPGKVYPLQCNTGLGLVGTGGTEDDCCRRCWCGFRGGPRLIQA